MVNSAPQWRSQPTVDVPCIPRDAFQRLVIGFMNRNDPAGVRGEILIVDSSTDSTPEKALARGARVLKTPKRGLGRAYIDAIPFIRGKYVLLGDADLTYDFPEIAPFLEKFLHANKFTTGSPFKAPIPQAPI